MIFFSRITITKDFLILKTSLFHLFRYYLGINKTTAKFEGEKTKITFNTYYNGPNQRLKWNNNDIVDIFCRFSVLFSIQLSVINGSRKLKRLKAALAKWRKTLKPGAFVSLRVTRKINCSHIRFSTKASWFVQCFNATRNILRKLLWNKKANFPVNGSKSCGKNYLYSRCK